MTSLRNRVAELQKNFEGANMGLITVPTNNHWYYVRRLWNLCTLYLNISPIVAIQMLSNILQMAALGYIHYNRGVAWIARRGDLLVCAVSESGAGLSAVA